MFMFSSSPQTSNLSFYYLYFQTHFHHSVYLNPIVVYIQFKLQSFDLSIPSQLYTHSHLRLSLLDYLLS